MYLLGIGCDGPVAGLLCLFVIYLVLILLSIPQEEEGLRKAYSPGYLAYQQKVKKLVPYLF